MTKRQVTDWEKIFANHTCDKRLELEHIKISQNSTEKRTNSPIRKWAKAISLKKIQRQKTSPSKDDQYNQP